MTDVGITGRQGIDPAPDAPEGPGRVLLAEDDLVNQRIVAAMLESLGFLVDVVADGAEAVQAASRQAYRAILMDCQLPVRDGYLATAEIRRTEGGRRTPIIAVTGSTSPSDRQRGLAAGMDGFLTKPLRLTTLAAALTEWTSVPTPLAPVVSAVDAPSAADPEPAVLDAVVVERLRRLGEATGEELFGQLTSLFLAAAVTHVAGLRAALAAHDPAGVAWSAHALRGAGASLGAKELARLCAALETAGTAGDLVGGDARLDAIEAELVRVRTALPPPALTP